MNYQRNQLIQIFRTGAHTSMGGSVLTFAPSAPGNPMPSAYYLRYIGLWHEIPPALAPKYPERSNGLSFAEGYKIKAPSTTQAIPRLSPDNASTQIHMLATDYQNECPGMSFTEAATRAETTIHNQLKRK